MPHEKPALINLIPKSIDKAAENLTAPATTAAGITFGDIWFLVFGGIGQAAEKRRLKYAADLNQFKQELDEKINAIPPEQLKEPDIQTIAPALENSKYCVEKKELRSMFSKLISSSMDSSKADYVHPSFGEIIKQMTPLDAQNLKLFENESDLPFCEYRIYYPNGKYAMPHMMVFLSNPYEQDIDKQARSISSLCRLGLLEINSTSKKEPAEEIYAPFKQTLLFAVTQKLASDNNGTATIFERKLQRTYLGEAFLQICLSD